MRQNPVDTFYLLLMYIISYQGISYYFWRMEHVHIKNYFETFYLLLIYHISYQETSYHFWRMEHILIKKTMINIFIPHCNVIYSSWKNYVSYLLSGKIIVSHILRWFFFDTPLFMLSRMICFRSVDGNRNKKRETDAYYLRYNVCTCNHAPAFYRARWLVKVTRHV